MLRLIQTFLLWRIYRNTRPPKPPKPLRSRESVEKDIIPVTFMCAVFSTFLIYLTFTLLFSDDLNFWFRILISASGGLCGMAISISKLKAEAENSPPESELDSYDRHDPEFCQSNPGHGAYDPNVYRPQPQTKSSLPACVQEKQLWKLGVFLVGIVIFGALWYLWGLPKDDLSANDTVVFCKLIAPPILFLLFMVVSFWLIDRKVDRKYQNLRDYQNQRASQNIPEMEEEMSSLDDPSEVLPPPVPRFGERGDLR